MIPGGRYTAYKRPGNFWDIPDVPIFSRVPKGERGNKKDIGEDWMLSAVKLQKKREEEGSYLPPLHVHHHGWLDSNVQPAGFFKLTRVGLIQYEGQEVPALFAKLIHVPDEIFQKMKNVQLPYRSVEVFDWEVPDIASLALLDHEVPFFRLEMLTIGQEIDGTESEIVMAPQKVSDAGPLVGQLAAARGGALCFSFRGYSRMADFPKKKKNDGDGGNDAGNDNSDDSEKTTKKPAIGASGASDNGADSECPECGETMQAQQDGSMACPECGYSDQAAGDNPNGDPNQEDGMSKISERLARIEAWIGTQTAAPPGQVTLSPVEQFRAAEAAKLAAAGGPNTPETARMAGEMAATSQKLAAVEKKLADRDIEEAARGKVSEILNGKLRGYVVPEADLKVLNALVRQNSSLVEDWTKGFLSHAQPDPEQLSEIEGGKAPGDNEVIMKFANGSPEDLTMARELSTEFDAVQRQGYCLGMKRERYIQIQMQFRKKEILSGKDYGVPQLSYKPGR